MKETCQDRSIFFNIQVKVNKQTYPKVALQSSYFFRGLVGEYLCRRTAGFEIWSKILTNVKRKCNNESWSPCVIDCILDVVVFWYLFCHLHLVSEISSNYSSSDRVYFA